MTDHYLSTPEAAAYLGVTRARIRQLCSAGRIGTKVGTYWMFTMQELREFAMLNRPNHRPTTTPDQENDQ